MLDIWESPELQPVLQKIAPNFKIPRFTDRQGRINGGVQATPGLFPHHTYLVIDDRYICGGSLIKLDWVLTVIRLNKLFLNFLKSSIFI